MKFLHEKYLNLICILSIYSILLLQNILIQYEDRHFLIVSQVQSCYSKLYEWISNSFEEVAKFRTGEVDQFVTVLDSDRVYLVTKNKQSTQCSTVGINLWIFAEKSLVVSKIDLFISISYQQL